MREPESTHLVFGERAYRLVLRVLFPRAFRERYALDMSLFYRERVARVAHSPIRTLALWPRLLTDLFVSASAEWLSLATHQNRGLTPRERDPEETMSILLQDIRYALRGMRHHPMFAAIVLATLALGIGANTAIFSVVDAVLLRPLPFANLERIVDVTHGKPYSMVSEPEFIDYQKGVPAFASLAAYNTGSATLDIGDQSLLADGSRGSRDFFPIVGTKPILGRTFSAEEFAPSSTARVTIISHALWKQQFAADPHVVGRVIRLNGAPTTIIGVMPAGFDFPQASIAFWTPWRLNPDSLWTRNNHYLHLVGRLAPGATIAQARSQARTLNARWLRDFPDMYVGGKALEAQIIPLRDAIVGSVRPYLLALIGAVCFILLIACANVANLLLVRGEARRKEVAIRTALGASGNRLVRQMLTESMVLATFGAMLGIVVAWAGANLLVQLAPGDVPHLDQIGVDARVVFFTLGITLITGLLFGAVPAFRGFAGQSPEVLREAGRTSVMGASRVARGTLVAGEIALAVMMLSGAGLLIRSLIKLRAVDLGFATEHVLTMKLTVPPKRHYTDTTTDELFRAVRTRVDRLPGVVSAALEGSLPIADGESAWSILLDNRVVKTIAEAATAKPDQVTPDYFKSMSIRVLRGRAIEEQDRMGAAPVVVINEAMARQYWPGLDPIGHTLKMFNPQSPWVTIVGVVADVHSRGYEGDVPPTMFFPVSQAATSAYYLPTTMTLVVRTTADPAAITPSVREVVRSLDPHIPISSVATMDKIVGESIASRRFTTFLLAGFAILALTLAGIGIYGVISFSVSQRTFEIGVRMALGASAASIMRLVLGEGARLALVGAVAGVVGSIAVDGLLRTLLVGVAMRDVPTFAGVLVCLAVVALAACLIPARRAMTVSPLSALREG